MRKTITRTICTSVISGCMLNVVDGKPTVENLAPITVAGKVSEKVAIKSLKAEYGKDKAITLTSIDLKEDTYEISVDDFMKYAKKVEAGTETEVSEN